MHGAIGQSLAEAYVFLEEQVQDLTFMLAGWEAHVDQASEEQFALLYYRAMLHNKLVTAAEIPPPNLDSLAVQISSRLQGVSLISSAPLTARIRPLLLSSPVPQDKRVQFEAAIKQAWSSVQLYDSEVTVMYQGQHRYATQAWSLVNNVHYALFINNSNPESVGAVVPSTAQLDEALTAGDELLGESCGCSALPVHTLYLLGELSSGQRATLGETIRTAWQASNLDLAADDIEISVRPENVRRIRKRQAMGDAGWYETEGGERLSPVDFTVSVRGSQADPLFVAEPSEQRLNTFLQTSVQTGTCGCTPVRCYSLRVKGVAEDSTPIVDSILAAYSAANPELSREQIDVYINYVNTEFLDSDGNSVSEVAYCVRRVPDGTEDELVEPGIESLARELADRGLTMVPNADEIYDGSSSIPETWVIIVIVVSAVVAFGLVFCSVMVIIQRRRNFAQQQKAKRTSQAGTAVTLGGTPYLDEEDFAGHGIMYGNGSIFGGGSIGSKTALYDNQRHYYNT